MEHKAEIDDMSKGNWVSKGVAVLQVSWFIVQIIGRHRYGLAVTPLEYGTTGFAVLCIVMYIMWWNKPLGVARLRRLHWKSNSGICPPEDLHIDESVLLINQFDE